MTPTLTDGQLLVIEKPAYWRATGSILDALFPVDSQGSIRYLVGGPNRGDLAVFHSPTEPGVDLIKRIIGRPNDTVLIDHGDVWINGQRLEEPYVQSRYDSSFEYPANGQPLTVPDGFYFVLGDNRLDSYDSHLGWLVPAGDLIGRAWLSYWPSLTWGFPARGTIPSRNPDDAVAATASLPTEPTLPPRVTPTQSALASDVSPASSDVAQVGAQPTATSAIATTVRATVLLSPVSAPSPAPATAAAPIPSPTTASASRPAPPPTSTSAPAPVAGPGLQLVAQGFGQRQQTVGFGFVLQNASDVLASDHTTYSLSALDARGAILATTTGDVGVVLPRQRLGVGGTVAVPRGASVDRIAVSVAPAAYYFPWTSSAVALKPTDVTWQPGAAKAIATIVNPYAIGLNRVIVGAIARDATGSIVGGGSAIVDSLPQDARVTVEVPVAWAGTSAQVEVFATLPSLPRIE
jgi:signal peptidase I